jgi:hypothetical protein
MGGTLTVLTNNGDGTLTYSATLAVTGYAYSVVAADVNGDGEVDLISANGAGNTLTVLTNNGDGTFTFSATLAVGGSPTSLAAADVNGDGKLDLISANAVNGNANANELTVLTSNGKGTFTLSSKFPLGGGSRSVVAADVNGDGKVDLISLTGSGANNTLMVLTNNGVGMFTISSTPGVGGPTNSVATVDLAADVNGDGKLDLVCAMFVPVLVLTIDTLGAG